MKLIIAGGRDFTDRQLLDHAMAEWVEKFGLPVVVLHGAAPGADTMGMIWACQNHVPFQTYRVDWLRYGKAAGPIRNKAMVDQADALVAFWDGISSGSADVIRQAQKANLFVHVFHYPRKPRCVGCGPRS